MSADRPLVFVSYAHEDKELCRRLAVMLGIVLKARGYDLWWDQTMVAGDWNPQIDEALERAVAGIVLVSVDSLASEFVMERELPRLRQRGRVAPVYARPCPWPSVPAIAELQFLGSAERWLAEDENRGELEVSLNAIATKAPDFLGLGVLETATARSVEPPALVAGDAPGAARTWPPCELHEVPELPPGYCERPAELDRLRALLLAPGAGTVGVGGSGALGLHGTGGIGKTVLAVAAARDPAVRSGCSDGVFWVTLGEHPDPVAVQATLARQLGLAVTFRDVAEGRVALRDALAGKRALVIIDDAWSAPDAEALVVVGDLGRALVTTRHTLVLDRLGARPLAVERLASADARRFLAHITGHAEPLPPEADQLVEALGGVVLALALVAATIAHGTSWGEALAGVAAAGHIYSDETFANQFKAMDLAWRALEEQDRLRYGELGVFGEDVRVPVVTVARLWRHTGNLDLDATAALLGRLGARGLASVNGAVGFHDLQRAFLQLQTPNSGMVHAQLLAAHEDVLVEPGRWATMPDDEPYLWEHLVEHLIAAGDVAGLKAVVADPAWILRRYHLRGPHAPEADLLTASGALPGYRLAPLLLHRLRQVSHLLATVTTLGDRGLTLASVVGGLVPPAPLAGLFPPIRLFPSRTLVETPDALESVLAGHTGAVSSLAWSPDGRRLASGSDDNSIMVWDPDAPGQPPTVLAGHPRGVSSVAWSPDGRHLSSISGDGAMREWDPAAAGGQLPAALSCKAEWGNPVAWSPDARLVVLVSKDDDIVISVWDPGASKQPPTQLRRERRWRRRWGVIDYYTPEMAGVAWSPDSSRVAAGFSDGTVRVWRSDAANHRPVVLTGLPGGVSSVAWSPDGRRLVAGSGDIILIWDTNTSVQTPSELAGHTGGVRGLAWSPDGRRVASGSRDGAVRVWSPNTPNQSPAVLAGHTGEVRCLAWSPDGCRLASGSYDRSVRVWDPDAAAHVSTRLPGHTGQVRVQAWAPDGRHLASGYDDGAIRVWDSEAPSQPAIALAGNRHSVTSLAWSPDGRRLASGDFIDSDIRIWDPDVPGQPPAVLTEPPPTGWSGHRDTRSLAWSPDGLRLASGSRTGIRLWDPRTPARPFAVLAGAAGGLGLMGRFWDGRALAWSPDGRLLASGSFDGAIKIWDPKAPAQPAASLAEAGHVTSLAWSPDGRLLASGSFDGPLSLWDTNTPDQPPALLPGHGGEVSSLAWSPDGWHLASGSSAGSVRVWDWRSQQALGGIALGPSVKAIAWHGQRIAVSTPIGWTVLQVEDATRE